MLISDYLTYTLPCGCDADDPTCTHRADQAEAEPDESPANPKPTGWEADRLTGRPSGQASRRHQLRRHHARP